MIMIINYFINHYDLRITVKLANTYIYQRFYYKLNFIYLSAYK
jgi:hypothetical protein